MLRKASQNECAKFLVHLVQLIEKASLNAKIPLAVVPLTAASAMQKTQNAKSTTVFREKNFERTLSKITATIEASEKKKSVTAVKIVLRKMNAWVESKNFWKFPAT